MKKTSRIILPHFLPKVELTLKSKEAVDGKRATTASDNNRQ